MTLTHGPHSTETLNLVTLRNKGADPNSSRRSNEPRHEPRWEVSAPNTHQAKKEKCKKPKARGHKESADAKAEATDDIYKLLQKLHSYDKEKECSSALTQVYRATGAGHSNV